PPIRAGVSAFSAATDGSALEEHRLGVFDHLLHRHQETDCFAAVDDPVVVREGDVHHRTDLDLPVHHDRTLDNVVHAEDADLRCVEDRRGEHRPVNTPVGDREAATLKLIEGQLAV